jgi:hypothetical protein
MKPNSKYLEQFLRPYVFLLKEGKGFENNFLDYSLLLLQVGEGDILYSPTRQLKKTSNRKT